MKTPLPLLRALWSSYLVMAAVLVPLVIGIVLLAPVAPMVLEHGLPWELLTRPAVGLLTLAALAYGVLRGAYFHPAFDAHYRAWLAHSAWTAERRLPKGPLHLVWIDLAIVGLLSALVYLLALTIPDEITLSAAARPAIVFVVGLTAVWTYANFLVGQVAHIYAVFWVPVGFAALGVPPIGWALCPAVMAGIAWLGVKRSLATCPWSELEIPNYFKAQPKKWVAILGWPYRELLSPVREIRTSTSRALMEAALAGGLVWAAMHSLATPTQKEVSAPLLFLMLGTVWGALFRLAMYSPVICSKFCWGQRLANKRPIVWRHDQILLAPLLMLAVGWALPRLLYDGTGASLATACSATAGLVALIARGMGPSIRELQYTGVHSKFGRLMLGKDFITSRGENG